MAFKRLKLKKRCNRGPLTVIVTDGGGFRSRQYRELAQGRVTVQTPYGPPGRGWTFPEVVWGTQGVDVHLQTNGPAWFTWDEWIEFVQTVTDEHNKIKGQEKLF